MGRHVSSRTAARIGTAVMVAILGSMAALVIAVLIWSRAEIADLRATIEVSDAYNQTALAAATASVHWNRFRETGSNADLLAFRGALQDTLRFEARVKEIGSDEDRAFLSELERRYATELAVAVQALQAIGAGGFDPAVLPDNEVLTDATAALAARAQEERQTALTALSSVQSTVQQLSAAAIALMLLGLPLVIGSYLITRRYEHKETLRGVEVERFKHAALTDGLTGLPNHRSFQEDLSGQVAVAGGNSRLAIAMIDVDGFKVVNDVNGHAHGDAVLARLASLMSHVGQAGAVRAYRVGGDEFALIMPGTSSQDAHATLERLRATVEASLPGTTVSVGYASSLDDDVPEVLRDHADMALYAAKRMGKNQVVAFYPSLAPAANVTVEKTQAIRLVLETCDIAIWYQPIFDRSSRRLLAYEALMRLPSAPEIDGPEEAFRIADSIGKARELDLLCLARALRTKGLGPGVKLFVNINPGTVANTRFSVDEVMEVVNASRLTPSQIVFELTEQTHAPPTVIRGALDALRAKGFGLALDDVGVANSGVEMLRLLSFDYLKIDRSLVVDAVKGGRGRAVILGIKAYAEATGAVTIAEGIDDEELLRGVSGSDGNGPLVQAVQGFLLAGPGPSPRRALPQSGKSEPYAA